MLSTSLDVLGLAALVAGVFVLAGLGFALVALWPCLMFVAYTVGEDEDKAAARALARLAKRAAHVASAPARVRRRRRAQPKVA